MKFFRHVAEILSQQKQAKIISGIVDLGTSVIGALAVICMRSLLPYALAFAVGALIFVVVKELTPESQAESSTDIATMGAMLGFAVMMFLDVALR